MSGEWRNPHNLICAPKALSVFRNPFGFALSLAQAKEGARIGLRTPIGPLTLTIRNKESVKTIYSIFLRNDYKTTTDFGVFIDCGGNIGVSSAYFLTRNRRNKVYVFEPDPNNRPYLFANLEPFAGRAFIFDDAVTSDGRPLPFHLSIDGKYSTAAATLRRDRLMGSIDVASLPIQRIIEMVEAKEGDAPITIKIDVEGMEEELVNAIDFARARNVARIIVESKDLGRRIPNVRKCTIRSGYVGDYLLKT
jgi:FkbM family methyltransferase